MLIGEIRKQLIDEDLSGVTFVRDYLQMQFNPPPFFNVYARCEIHVRGNVMTFGEPLFANTLIACIGSSVIDVRDNEVSNQLEIELQNMVQIVIPYADGTFDGPEAYSYHGKEGLLVVGP